MALTIDEFEDIRDATGADDPNVYSDAKIQAKYDLAVTDAPTTALVLPYAYVYILRALWAIQRTKADRSTEHGDKETRSQIREATKELLDYWEAQTGLSAAATGAGNIIRVGVIGLDLNSVNPDDEYEG